jgi:hypothetical protein
MQTVRLAASHYSLVGAAVLSILLIIASSDQLRHFQGFLEALRAYAALPRGPETKIAILIIVAELVLAAGLLHPRYRRLASLAAAVLLGCLTLIVGLNLLFTPSSTCGTWYTLTLGKPTVGNVLQGLLFIGLALATRESSPTNVTAKS